VSPLDLFISVSPRADIRSSFEFTLSLFRTPVGHVSQTLFVARICGAPIKMAHGRMEGCMKGRVTRYFPAPHQRGPGKKIPGEIFMVLRAICPHRS
jgi:hypothetical protein